MRDWNYKGKRTAWNGISKYLALNSNKGGNSENINRTIKEFLISSNLPFDKRNNGHGESKNAEEVQKNWNQFLKYLSENNQ